MSTQFDGDDTIYSGDVIERITELESILEDEKLFEVMRVSDARVLGSFTDQEDAEQFIKDEDYVPDRVEVIELDSEVDTDELDELRSFSSEGRDAFGVRDWNSGMTVRRGDSIDESYAREYASDRGDRFDAIGPFVNWDEFIDQYILDGEESATLNGDEYYNV